MLPFLLIGVVVAAAASFWFTRAAGRAAARHISSFPYRSIAQVTIAGIVIMVALFTGHI